MNVRLDVKQRVSRRWRLLASPFDKPLSLRTNFAWTFAGNVTYTASQWAMLAVIAKLGTPEMVGQFALGLAITAPVIMFTNLQLRGVQATDVGGKYRFGDYLGLRILATLVALLVIVGIVIATGYPLETASVILVVGLAKALESLSDVFYGLFQRHEWMSRIAKSMMIKGPLSLIALGSGILLGRNVLWGTVGMAIAWALVLFSYDVPGGALVMGASDRLVPSSLEKAEAKMALRPFWGLRTLARLAWLALPLGLTMMLISLNTNIPRYALERSWGQRELGFFAAMAYLMVAGNLVVSALGQSALPRLAGYYAARNRRKFCTLLLQTMSVGAGLGVCGILLVLVAGRGIMDLFYGSEYANYPEVLLWLMVTAAIGYLASFLGYGLTAARYFRPQLPLLLVVAATTAIACLRLVPSYGLQGAALSLVISSVVLVLGNAGIMAYAVRALPRDQAASPPSGGE